MNAQFDIKPKIEEKRAPLTVLPNEAPARGHFPSWLHRKPSRGKSVYETEEIIHKNRLHTVCEEAKCPNLTECYSHKTATFLIMGKDSTRACGFCEFDFST